MRVRVHGLQKKPEFNDRAGTVKGAVAGGRWCVLLDGEPEGGDGPRELSLKPENFAALADTRFDLRSGQVAARAGAGDEAESEIDYLENGAVVCKAHRLETCGACGMDFRPMNGDRGVSAPLPEPLSIKAKKLGAHDEGLHNLDPARLPAIVDVAPRAEWGGRGPLVQAFTQQSFSLYEKLQSQANNRPSIDVDLSFHVRETHLAISATWEQDRCRAKFVQDSAQSIGLCILCLGAYEAGTAAGGRAGLPERPILLVWYQANSVTDPKFMDKMQKMNKALAKAKQVGAPIPGEAEGISNAEVDRKEVEALKILLDSNAKLLSPQWLATNKPPSTFTASFITPLKKKAMSHEAGAKESERVCVCGAANPKHKCTRCSSIWYCGKDCQVCLFVCVCVCVCVCVWRSCVVSAVFCCLCPSRWMCLCAWRCMLVLVCL